MLETLLHELRAALDADSFCRVEKVISSFGGERLYISSKTRRKDKVVMAARLMRQGAARQEVHMRLIAGGMSKRTAYRVIHEALALRGALSG
ncbi:MAG: hypothetical protein Q8O37_09040 [Sulfuricellaceae bacterium]|nr:hypothetical protein [Sulfuricellaceae bacterium]